MKQLLYGTAAGLLLLALTTTASAQHYGGHRHGGGNYGPRYEQPLYSQYGPAYCDPYTNSGASFNYSTPGFGLGIYSSPGYGPGINIYSGPSYGRSYYPPSYIGGHGHNSHHHHHHHHR